jgi:DNA-binding MarR family transcriptional regulator
MIHGDNIVHVTQIVNATATKPRTTAAAARDELIEHIIADFKVTIGAMKCAMSERLVRQGVSMAQLHIMVTLQRNGVMTMSRLADVLGVSMSNATGLVDRMEERGFVERTRVPEDRRIVLVRVTDAGTRMLQANDAISDELMRQVLGRLDPSELPIIARATGEVRAALEADPATQAATTQPARNLHETPTPEPRSR